METGTIKKTGDELRQWMLKRGITMERLAEPSGMTQGQLAAYLNGSLFATGRPHRITPQVAARLTDGVHALAEQLAALQLTWGSDDMKQGRGGVVYDRGCVERIMGLRSMLNVRPFVIWALGWNANRYNNLLISRCNIYGNITPDMVNGINEALVGMAAQMAAMEIVPDVSSEDSSSS